MAHELLTVIGHFCQNLNSLAGAFFRYAYQERSVVLVGLGHGDIVWVCAYAATGLKSDGKIFTILVFRCTRSV
jgi:hypothetical protein